jgi:cytoskeleton protein RodZ
VTEPIAEVPAQPSKPEEFGRYLARERELRSITLKHVAEVTRISEDYLRALEEGRHERLPGRVFIVGYVRSYAKCIGLSSDDAVLRFQESFVAAAVAGRTRGNGDSQRHWIAVVLVAALVLAVGLFWLLHARA